MKVILVQNAKDEVCKLDINEMTLGYDFLLNIDRMGLNFHLFCLYFLFNACIFCFLILFICCFGYLNKIFKFEGKNLDSFRINVHNPISVKGGGASDAPL